MSVDTRARQLPKLYKDKVQNIDRQYLNTETGSVGPLERRLQDFGDIWCLVVGQFSEVSQDVHKLLSKLANEKSLKLQRMYGRSLSSFELSQVLQQFRRRLSICAIRSQSGCLLSRIGHYGDTAAQAAKRRDQARAQDEAAKLELRAQWEASVRGQRISRVGVLHI